MAENGKNQNDDSRSGDGKASAPAVPPGAAEVRTSDPIASAPDPGPPPERAASYQTAGSLGPPSIAPLPGSGGVEQSGDKNDPRQLSNAKQHRATQENHQNRKRRHRNTDADEGRDGPDDERRQHGRRRRHGAAQAAKSKLKRVSGKMPHWSALLIVCVLSVICGAGGAWAYSEFFGASQSEDDGKNSAKSDKSSKNGDGAEKQSDKSGGSDSDQDAETSDLSKNLQDLGDGITQLTARLDRLTESIQEAQLPVPEYYSGTSRIARMAPAASAESPPLQPNAVPTQLNVLERKVEQMSDLPARIQSLENAVNSLKEEIRKSSSSSTPAAAGEP